jgi:hypothetical protein
MATKVRRQIYLGQEQDARLRREAKTQGISTSELIRNRLDTPAISTFRARPNPDALKKVFEFIEKRKALGQTGKPWRWNREEIYEERLSRYGKRVSD